MTLTMLRPWPSVGPNSAKYSRSRGAVSVVETEQHQPANERADPGSDERVPVADEAR